MNKRFARAFLQRNLPGLASSRVRISDCDISPIKYNPARSKAILMFDLSLKGPDGHAAHRSIVGRFTREYREDGQSFDLFQELWKGGFGGDSDLRICEPLLYVPARGLVVVSKAGGVDLQTMSSSPNDSLPAAVKRAADWIAKLHRVQVRNGRIRPTEDEEAKIIEKVGQAAAEIGATHPSLNQRARRAVRRILEEVRSLDEPSRTLIHGDYLPKNIFFDGSTVTAIDLDGSRLFDPAKDLGKFLGRLAVNVKLYGLPFSETSLRSSFLSAYSKGIPDETLTRAAAYEAILFMKQSKREPDLSGARYWLERAEERVGEDQ